MAARRATGSMIAMPDVSALTRRVLVEVAVVRSASPMDPIVRRYRLARVPLYTSAAPVPDHFAHLRRSPD